MADSFVLRYQNQDVVFEKSKSLVAVRARAGMADAMQADIDTIAVSGGQARRQMIGAFEIVELRTTEVALDWLRARPSVAAASHVFTMQGKPDLMVPDGHVRLVFDGSLSGYDEQQVLTRYRLQATEKRGNGEYLARITSGSKNPLATAIALQAEPGVSLAEPEFVDAD